MNLRQLDGAGWVCQPQAPGGGLTRVWPSGLRCGNAAGGTRSAVPDRSEIGPYRGGSSGRGWKRIGGAEDGIVDADIVAQVGQLIALALTVGVVFETIER